MRKSSMGINSMLTYKTFQFDHVFGEEESQESLYENAQIQFYVKQVV